MRRTIVAPAAIGGAALAELKGWLGITINSEDSFLEGLLRAALETCEAFTGQVPLEVTAEEIHPADTAWRGLATRPVQAVTAVEGIPAQGGRFPLAPGDYVADLSADGSAHLRLLRPQGSGGAAGRIAVRFVAGLAADWAGLPESLRHGVIRLAADGYRRRDGEPGAGTGGAQPPSAIAALWRPWRRMRLA